MNDSQQPTNPDLKAYIMRTLKLESASQEVQDSVFTEIAQAANEKILLAIDQMLTDEQVDHIAAMQQKGESADTILDWIESHIPNYPDMLNRTMQDIADEVGQAQDMSEKRAAVDHAADEKNEG